MTIEGLTANPNGTPYGWEELYRLALDSFPGSVMIIDDQANILYCNSVTEDMLGVSREWLRSTNMHTVIQYGLAERSVGVEAMEKGSEVMHYVTNYRREGMLISSVPVKGPEGAVRAVFTYSQDEQYLLRYVEWMDHEKTKILSALQMVAGDELHWSSIVAESPAMKRLLQTAEQVAPSSATIAIYGESGVGKEVVARFLHEKSKRSAQVFLPINCSAIPESLAESEFFGYEKGAFTGASQNGKMGFFEIANRGTLFLDEVGELPLSLQAKLLRVLETGELSRVGGGRVFHVDTRIICATNRDLWQMVQEGTFREDLYYRLNVLPLTIPPLRERKEDILPLAQLFLQETNRKNGCKKVLSPETVRAIKGYSWPGNVRELRNLVERMVVVTRGDIITGGVGGQEPAPERGAETGSPLAPGLPLKEAMRELERRYIEASYRLCGGSARRTAELLKVHPSGLYRKLAEYGIGG